MFLIYRNSANKRIKNLGLFEADKKVFKESDKEIIKNYDYLVIWGKNKSLDKLLKKMLTEKEIKINYIDVSYKIIKINNPTTTLQ